MIYAKVVAGAWSDEAFKAKLTSDPDAALAEHGVGVPPGMTAKTFASLIAGRPDRGGGDGPGVQPDGGLPLVKDNARQTGRRGGTVPWRRMSRPPSRGRV